MDEMRVLLDRQAIIDVLLRYADLVDRGRFDEAAEAVFSVDALEDHGFGFPVHRGRAEIAAFLRDVLTPFAGAMHALSNFMIEIDGDRASSRTYLQAYHWLKGDADPEARPADYISTGVYVDAWIRTGEGWRIAHRQRRPIGPSAVGVGTRPAHLWPGRKP